MWPSPRDLKQPLISKPTALHASGRGNACASGSFCAKGRNSIGLKSAATLSKTSPERLIFEKTGVEIQRQTCRGHLDMTAVCVVNEAVGGAFHNVSSGSSTMSSVSMLWGMSMNLRQPCNAALYWASVHDQSGHSGHSPKMVCSKVTLLEVI